MQATAGEAAADAVGDDDGIVVDLMQRLDERGDAFDQALAVEGALELDAEGGVDEAGLQHVAAAAIADDPAAAPWVVGEVVGAGDDEQLHLLCQPNERHALAALALVTRTEHPGAERLKRPHEHRQSPGDEPGSVVLADGAWDEIHGRQYTAAENRSD